MSTKRIYADTDYSTSESDSDRSDSTDDDQEYEHEIDPWAFFENESNEKKDMPEFEELNGDFYCR